MKLCKEANLNFEKNLALQNDRTRLAQNISSKVTLKGSCHCVAVGSVISWEHWNERLIPGWAQWIKDPVGRQELHVPQGSQKLKKIEKKIKNTYHEGSSKCGSVG